MYSWRFSNSIIIGIFTIDWILYRIKRFGFIYIWVKYILNIQVFYSQTTILQYIGDVIYYIGV